MTRDASARSSRPFVLIAVLALVAAVAGPVGFAQRALAQATIVGQNADGPGEGFNDPAPFAPVGGNNAVTLGQARLNAFQHAANIWAQNLGSNVVIVVRAQMDPLYCDAAQAVLGSAGASTVHANFPNAPVPNTWYCQALANSYAGVDLDATQADIEATFNSSLNGSAGCLGGVGWYYGFDGSPGGNIDFVTVVLHEIGHGLGFQMFADVTTGARFLFRNDVYMLNIEQAGVATSYITMTDEQRVEANRSDPNLRWNGASVTAQVPLVPVTGGLSGGKARLHAPNPIVVGSSVSHFSSALAPNELMEPAYTGANHDVGLALNLMQDIGWSLACAPEPTTMAGTDTLTIAQTAGSLEVQVEVTNTGAFDASSVAARMSGGPSWLRFTDDACAYPDLAAGTSSFGLDSYRLDITNWPGGAFTVNLEVSWRDVCGIAYGATLPVSLLPPNPPAPRFSNRLEPNVPNPFSPETTIPYQLARAGRATLRIYDVAGRLVRTLEDRVHEAGSHEARWDGADDSGRPVASGVYFYRLQAGDFSQAARMVRLNTRR